MTTVEIKVTVAFEGSPPDSDGTKLEGESIGARELAPEEADQLRPLPLAETAGGLRLADPAPGERAGPPCSLRPWAARAGARRPSPSWRPQVDERGSPRSGPCRPRVPSSVAPGRCGSRWHAARHAAVARAISPEPLPRSGRLPSARPKVHAREAARSCGRVTARIASSLSQRQIVAPEICQTIVRSRRACADPRARSSIWTGCRSWRGDAA